jgi:CheY-like chemotaxis protein
MSAATLDILYVDDSAAQLDGFRQSLAGGPYRVRTANSVREAEMRMAAERPDLVVIDYHMPEMMGDRALTVLKRSGADSTRYYLYTSDPHAFRRHREMGFDGVLMLKGKSSVRSQIDAIARAMVQFRG